MNQVDFNIQLMKKLCNIQDDAHVTVYEQKATIKEHQPIVMVRDSMRNCKRCYALEKQQRESVFYSKICDHYICLNKSRNCMAEAHFNLV